MALAFRVNGPLWSRPGLACDGRDDANGWTALGLGGLAYEDWVFVICPPMILYLDVFPVRSTARSPASLACLRRLAASLFFPESIIRNQGILVCPVQEIPSLQRHEVRVHASRAAISFSVTDDGPRDRQGHFQSPGSWVSYLINGAIAKLV